LATDRIQGKGYSVIVDEALTTLPEAPPGAAFNAEEQAKYREFKGSAAGGRQIISGLKANSPSIWRMCIRMRRLNAIH
jgi:hypothetical protein